MKICLAILSLFRKMDSRGNTRPYVLVCPIAEQCTRFISKQRQCIDDNTHGSSKLTHNRCLSTEVFIESFDKVLVESNNTCHTEISEQHNPLTDWPLFTQEHYNTWEMGSGEHVRVVASAVACFWPKSLFWLLCGSLVARFRAMIGAGWPAQIWAGCGTIARFDQLQPSDLAHLAFLNVHEREKRSPPCSSAAAFVSSPPTPAGDPSHVSSLPTLDGDHYHLLRAKGIKVLQDRHNRHKYYMGFECVKTDYECYITRNAWANTR
jgi:hypothetical protein